MRRVRTHRADRVDLLNRPPSGALDAVGSWGPPGVEPLDQLDELSDLWRRGLLTGALYERQRDEVLGAGHGPRLAGRPPSSAGPGRRPRPASSRRACGRWP